MADTSLTATYTTQRRTADRDELLRWREETLAEPPAPTPTPAPAGPEKKPESPGIVKAGASAFWDTFQSGAQNVADAIYAKAPQSTGTSIGQGVLGALQFASALPAGAGAMVREAVKTYAPGMESATAIPGGTNSAAGFIRTALGVPGLLLDPKMKTADPQALAGALNEPMTYGELIDVLTQFAAPVAFGKAVGAMRGRGGAAPPGPEQPAGPVRPLRESQQALPPGQQAAGALPERVLVTPPPEGGGMAAGGAMTPGEVAIELRTVLERLPKPEPARAGVRPYQDPATLIEGPTPEVPTGLVDAQGRPVAAPVVEALAERDRLRAFERTPLDAPPRTAKPETAGALPDRTAPTGDLGTALETVMKKMDAVVREEMTAAPEAPAAAVPTVPVPEGAPVAAVPGAVATALGEAGRVDPALLARMAIGAAAGGAVGDTPEERIAGALLGMGLGAAVTKRLAARLAETYKQSGLADETGAIDFSKFRARPAVQATEQPFQPNYRRLALTPELKRFSVNLHRMMKDEILERRGGVKTEEATVTAARQLLADGKMTAERLLTLEDQAVLSREEITAARMIGQRSRDYSAKLNDAYKAGQVSGEEFMDAFAVAAAISKNVRVAQTRIAQAQQASHIKVGVEHPSAYRPDDVIHLADDLAKNATPAQLSKALDSIEQPATRQKVTELAAVLPRAFLEIMYFSYLSGKATLRNAIGGLVMPPVAMADMAIAPYMARWGKAAQTERVLPGSATQMFAAYQESMLDMFHMLKFWDPAARKRLGGLEEEVSGGRQLESRYAPAFTAENMPVLGPAADLLGTVFRLPGHILGTTDAMAKMVNARMWQRFEAFHQASREGRAGPEIATRIDQLMDDPTLLSDLARERIQDFTERQTFTKDLEGGLLAKLQSGPENPWLNAAYRWQLLPFFRTPARAMETGILHTPVLNMTMTKFWSDMAGGGRTQQIAQARLVFGTAIMGAFAYLESQGGITGDGPTDPTLKKQWADELGWQRRSWWDFTAGKWRSYDGIAPVSDWIAAGADMSAAARRTPGDLGAMALAAGLGMATAFDTKAYTQTLSDWFSFMRPGTSDDSMAERFVSLMFRRLQGVANPGVLRELETLTDPEIRRARPSGAADNVMSRELDVLKRNWMSQIPGLSSLKDAEGFYVTPPDRDRIDGAPTMIETAPFVPFPSRTPKVDALKQHIFGDLQGAGFSPWPEWLGGGRPTADVGIGTREAENVTTGARMTPQEKDIYVRLFTQEVKDGQGLTYRQALEAAVANPLYQAQSTIGASGTPRDGGKARWLHRIDAQFHELTEAALRARAPALDREVKRKEQERVIRKAPTAEQPNVRQLLQGLTR